MQANIPSNSSFGPSSISFPGSRIRKLQAIQDHNAVESLVRWAFYLFAASLPFEPINLGVPVEVTMITGGVLVLSTMLQPRLFYRWPSGAFWCFIIFVYICVVRGTLEEATFRAELTWELLILIQLVVFCWIAYNLMRYHQIAKMALLVFAASCTTLAVLQVLGLAATVSGDKVERVTTLGFHANNVARIFALGLLVLIGFTNSQSKTVLRPRILAWSLVAVLGIAIVQTGSRGGILALGAGLLAFALTGESIGTRLRQAFVVLFAIGCLTLIAYQSETTRLRFESALEQGELARREDIYPTAWQMFMEKPLFGWGQVTSSYELGARLAHREEVTKNSHNLILQLLIVTGISGAIPMLVGTWLAVRAAWKARRSAHGILPFAMVTTVLAANMSGLWHFNKLHWIVVAYALASGNYLCRRDGVAGCSNHLLGQTWPQLLRGKALSTKAYADPA